jgi:hypothetical protein
MFTMTVGRDYRTSSKYEFVIFRDEEVAERKGFFTTSTQAKRAGLKVAQALIAAEEERCPSLPL